MQKGNRISEAFPNFRFSNLKPEHVTGVIDLLQRISDFRPNVETYERNLISYVSQDNLVAVVIEDLKGDVIGFGSLLLEKKLRGGVLGHVEDIVIAESHSGAGVGKHLVNHIVDLAVQRDCYKVTLSCSADNQKFYEKCGFNQNGSAMSLLIAVTP
jgi:ribosomal protein S18 acetylase RimI-like enzyme